MAEPQANRSRTPVLEVGIERQLYDQDLFAQDDGAGYGASATPNNYPDELDDQGYDSEDTSISELYPDEVKVHIVLKRPGMRDVIFSSILKRTWTLSNAFSSFEHYVRENHNNYQTTYNGSEFHIDGRTTPNSLCKKAGFGKNEKVLRLVARDRRDLMIQETAERRLPITIIIRGPRGTETVIETTRGTHMHEVFEEFYSRSGISPVGLGFYLNNEHISNYATPHDFKVFGQAEIDARHYTW